MSNKLLFGRVIDVSVDNGKQKGRYTNSDLHIEFEVPFDDDPKPNISKINIFNLSRNSIAQIKKNSNITLTAGYKTDGTGVILQGKCTRCMTYKNGTETITEITIKEGHDYSGIKVDSKLADPSKKYYVKKRVKLDKPVVVKYKDKQGRTRTKTTSYKTIQVAKYKKQVMRKSFAKGTKASTIIRWCANALGMKLAELNLPRDKVYKSGYIVSGRIEDKMEEVVKNCGASMYYRRGRMVIRSIKAGDDERFIANASTGLISAEEYEDEDGKKGYTLVMLLQFRITTASIITVQSERCRGQFRVKSGRHYFDGNDFFTEVVVF